MEKLLLSLYAGLSFNISKIINLDFSIEKQTKKNNIFIFQDILTQRYTSLLNLRKKFTDEFSHIRQDGEQQQQQPRMLSGTIYQSPMTTSSTQSKSNVTQASATFMT